MNISKKLLAGCFTTLSLMCAFAQPLSSSQQEKALEVLRQKIAEERSKASAAVPAVAPAMKPADPGAVEKALLAVRESIAKERAVTQPKPAPVAKPAVPEADSEQAVNSVREAILAQRRAKMEAETAKSAAVRASPSRRSVDRPVRPALSPPAVGDVAPAPSPVPVAPPAESARPSGPKTKQARLAELLELYKADKISPVEYHQQRAKIIAEP